jgi:hypothetical protein
MEFFHTLQSFALEYGKMFAYVGMVGILLAFGVPVFLAIMASSKAKQEERIRVLAKARADYHEQEGPWAL